MKYKLRFSRVLFLVLAVAFLLCIGYACFIPIWHIINGSFSQPAYLNSAKGIIYWPLGKVDVNAYKMIFKYKKLWLGYRNTIFYIVAQCAITGVLTVIAGFIFSRKRFYYRNAFMLFISFTMMFHGGMIPTYMVIKRLGLLDTVFAILLPTALSVFNIIIMRTSMQNISDALEEAARIDGANEFTIMFRVILPLCKATFAVIMLFTIVAKWNDYMSALLYLPNRDDLQPLQMVLRTILNDTNIDMSNMDEMKNSMSTYKKAIQYGVIVVSTVPILCIYPFVQKYFVTGMTIGAVKS